MNTKSILITCAIILLTGVVVVYLIFNTEPTAQRSGATKKTAMLVDVEEVKAGDFRPSIEVTGMVEPTRDIMLNPRVGGEIIRRSDDFSPGSYVRKGQMLLQIDPSDYRNMLQQRKSELQQAKADLKIEQGRQEVARKDYALVGDSITRENKSLALREPQLESVRSTVQSAEAAVDNAQLALNRTTIKAPFNAQILSRNANIGSQVASGDNLGRMVGVDEYWIAATVPVSKLRWLTFPGEKEEKGARVKIRNRTAWEEGVYRTGYLDKKVGTLEDQTRMARVLITVPDPLVYHTDTANVPDLMIGAFVQVKIQAKKISDVVRVNRDYIRQNETVWVMEDEKLRIRDVTIIFRDAKYAYITEGLEENARVVTTNLSTVVDGSKLRTTKSNTSTSEDTTSNGQQ